MTITPPPSPSPSRLFPHAHISFHSLRTNAFQRNRKTCGWSVRPISVMIMSKPVPAIHAGEEVPDSRVLKAALKQHSRAACRTQPGVPAVAQQLQAALLCLQLSELERERTAHDF